MSGLRSYFYAIKNVKHIYTSALYESGYLKDEFTETVVKTAPKHGSRKGYCPSLM